MKIKISKKYTVFLYLYALFFLFYFSVSTMARYASTLNSSGTTTVAKWDVSISGLDNQTLPTITIGGSSTYQNYTLTVTSYSEIALDYSLIIDNAPNGLRVQVDGGTTYDAAGGSVTIGYLGSFVANDSTTTHTHTLKFMVPIGGDEFSNQELGIDVIFTQVDL
jgi:hypothetical protein